MNTQEKEALYLSTFYLDESTRDKVGWLIENHMVPIQRKTTLELFEEILKSDRTIEEKNWLLSFLKFS